MEINILKYMEIYFKATCKSILKHTLKRHTNVCGNKVRAVYMCSKNQVSWRCFLAF